MPQWHRTEWMESVWSCPDLKPLEKLVAAVYADHARDERIAWVSLSRLHDRTGLSRDAANRALRGLVDKSWLIQIEKAKQHYSTRYALTIPEGWTTDASSTPDGPLDDAAVRQTDGWDRASSTPDDLSSPSHDTSSTPRVPDLRSIPDRSHSARTREPLRSLAAKHLQLREDDALLEQLDRVLEAKGVRAPHSWIPKAARNGTLRKALVQSDQASKPHWLRVPEGWL